LILQNECISVINFGFSQPKLAKNVLARAKILAFLPDFLLFHTNCFAQLHFISAVMTG